MVTEFVLSLSVFVAFYSAGVLCQSFTGLSGGVCPGGSATFTCVADDTTTTWIVNSEGMDSTCVYSQAIPTDSCGPGNRFMSSQTENGGTESSSLMVTTVTNDLNETSVTCSDGSTFVGNSTICIIDVLGSPEIQSADVSGLGDEENMCILSLEWSEAIVSCAGSVTYILTATPCLSVSGDCEVVGGSQTTSTTETQITLSVDGSVGLEYDFNVTAEICDGTFMNTSSVYSVDLTANVTGNDSFFYYFYNNVTFTIEVIVVTWPRYFVLGSETPYRVVIDEQTFEFTAADNCSEEMCTFSHYPTESLTDPPDNVEVQILGCTTMTVNAMDISSFCPPEDMLPPGVKCPGECSQDELLPCSNPIAKGGDMQCCDDDSLCTTYTGVTIGNSANYSTSEGYCIINNPLRRCFADMSWSEQIPAVNKVSERQQLSSANIALIIVGLILFIAGVAISIAVVVLSWPEKGATKNSQTEALRICCKCFVLCCCPCWVKCCVLLLGFSALFLAIVLPILEVIPWIAAFVYVATHTFTVDDGDYRKSDSLCESPTGKVATRDGLFIFSFVVSLLIFLIWLVYLVYLLYKRYCAKEPLKPPGAEEPLEMGETYDVIQRNQPSSKPTQKLLSESDPSYGKLDKSKMQSEEPGHYGKLDRTGNKKTATIAPAVGDAEYGKLDRTQMQPEEPGHYGKLDRGGKTSTLPVAVTGSDEYGKLDRSQMENPLHYGKLDHPGKKGATLTGGVAPTDTQGYGKLDKTQMQASGSTGGGGEMYDTVSHESRHQVQSTKSKRQHSSSGEEASLL